MKKKIEKKKKGIIPKRGFKFQLRSTIMSNIMFVMLLTVVAIMLSMSAFAVTIIKSMQKDLPAEFISSLKIFNEKYNTSQEFEQRLYSLKDDINNVILKNYNVKDIYVSDANRKPVFTTFQEGTEYRYETNSPISFKLLTSPTYTASNYRAVYVPKTIDEKINNKIVKKQYNIHLIIPQENDKYINSIKDISKTLFCIIIVASFIIVLFLSRKISKPLFIMEETVSKIAKGDLSGRLDYTAFDEINKLVQSYNMMANALQRLYSSLEVQVQDKTKELKSAYNELQSTQAMMVHSEKMKSLGELVAGIMHEINNPINFIYGNMTHLSNYSNDLINIIEEYTKYNESLKPEEKEDIENLKQEIDYEFLKTDLPDLIKSCKEGADRAKNIIQDLKSFSRMEEATITDVDLPHEIDTTLNILHNKIKNKATVHKEYNENVPKVEAFGGQLNQVFMNILDNAVGAIKETGDIWIRMNEDKDNKNLIIEIEDNGIGMDEETSRKVFNPFFTTKPVGQGTGLGMSITYKIIKNHQGDIRVESKQNLGTKFIIRLPINIDRENLNASMISGDNNG